MDRIVYPQLRRSTADPKNSRRSSNAGSTARRSSRRSSSNPTELTPEAQLAKFNKFINYRGIKRVKIRSASPNSINSEDIIQQREERLSRMSLLGIGNHHETLALIEIEDPVDEASPEISGGENEEEAIVSDIDDFNMGIDENRIADYLGISRDQDNPDADEFYSDVHYRKNRSGSSSSSSSISAESNDHDDHETGDTTINNDKEYEYIAFDKYGDRRYSNNSKYCIKFINHNVKSNDKFKLPLNPQTAYVNWEFHTKRIQKEISCDANDDEDNDDNYNDEGAIIDSDKDTLTPASKPKEESSLSQNSSSSELNGKPSLDRSMSIIYSDDENDEYLINMSSEESTYSDDDSFNGGIYYPFRPGFTSINTTNYEKIVELPPGKKFKDGLGLDFIGIKKLYDVEMMRKYKNNLSCVISDFVRGQDYFITCTNAQLLIYSFNTITYLPLKNPVLKFDTRPTFTTTTDRVVSTWPYFPHTLNCLKTCDKWCGKQVLGAVADDASVLIWFTEDIIGCIDKFKRHQNPEPNDSEDNYSERNRFYGFKINPLFKLKMTASAWGIDFLSYKDRGGQEHNLIVASDNSQSITLFYYHPQDERFYSICSHQLLHNIPDVSFVDRKEDETNLHTIEVACSSISGELVVFAFCFRIDSGPLAKADYEHFSNQPVHSVEPSGEDAALEAERFQRVQFKPPQVVSRTMLGEDVWTCKVVGSQYFLPVQSLRAMTGDPWINETNELENIVNESTILDLLYDPVQSSHLGGSTAWQFFETPVVSFSKNEMGSNIFESAKLTSIDDDYRRIHKGVIRDYKRAQRTGRLGVSLGPISLNGYGLGPVSLNGNSYRLQGPPEPLKFLAVTTAKRVGLFRADTLFCPAATKRVFDLKIPFNDDSKYSNRMSLSVMVPELLCFIVASQQGLVSIMRLCQHRGVYGMRQEHVFPNAPNMALGLQGYRTIAGLTVRNLDRHAAAIRPKFGVYITYTDGVVVGYQLHLSPLFHDITVANL